MYGTGSGVICGTSSKLRGGNSAFAFIGHHNRQAGQILVKISTKRHNPDPAVKPLFGTDKVTLTLKRQRHGNMVDFEGNALQLPRVAFKATLTRISD